MTSSRERGWSRRSVVLTGAGGLLLAGCDLDLGSDGEAAPGSASTTSPPTSADQRLVDQVGAQINTASAALAVRITDAGLTRKVADLRTVHARHLELLEITGTGPGAGTAQVRRPAAHVRQVETRLQRQLVDAAVAAESGTLAKLFASMSAALSQRLVQLP